jgi:hypothetical protein
MKDQEIKELITIPRCAGKRRRNPAIIREYHAQWVHERGNSLFTIFLLFDFGNSYSAFVSARYFCLL